jgi:hypothetical protein
LENDVLLDVLVGLWEGLQVGVLAVRTFFGCRHWNDFVNVFGFGPLPRRMAHRSAALFSLVRGTVRRWRGRSLAPFELAPVQGVELSLDLLVLPFQLLALPPLLIEEAIEFFELIFILALRPGHLLIAMKDPTGGQPFQIRTTVAVRTAEVIRKIFKLGHR